MGLRLDVRQAVREANVLFGRFPVQFCMPMICLDLSVWAIDLALHHTFGKGLALCLVFAVFIGCVALNFFAQAVVGVMYLRARNAGRPELNQVGEVRRLHGVWSVIWGLLIRYIGYSFLAALSVLLVGAIVTAAGISRHGLDHTSGIGAAAGGLSAGFWLASGWELAFELVFSRYLFVMPVVAILRGDSGPDILADVSRRTRSVWGLAMLLAFAETLPFILARLSLRLTLGNFNALDWRQSAAEGLIAAAGACFLAWFVLVKTNLALQLLERLPLIPRLAGEVPWLGPASRFREFETDSGEA